MSTRDSNNPYSPTQANDPLEELVERARTFWRENKARKITAANITSVCNAISAVLQSFPQ